MSINYQQKLNAHLRQKRQQQPGRPDSERWAPWADIVEYVSQAQIADLGGLVIDKRYAAHLPELKLEETAPPQVPSYYMMAEVVRLVVADIAERDGDPGGAATIAITMGLNLGVLSGFAGVLRLQSENGWESAMIGIAKSTGDLALLRANSEVTMTVDGSAFDEEQSDIKRACAGNMTYWWLDRAATVVTEMLYHGLPYSESRLSIVDDARSALWDAVKATNKWPHVFQWPYQPPSNP